MGSKPATRTHILSRAVSAATFLIGGVSASTFLAPPISVLAQPVCSGNCFIGDFVQVGSFALGDGALLLDDGTVLAVPDGLFVGANGTDEGILTVRGAGTALNYARTFTSIGADGGTGIVTVEDDGLLSNTGVGENFFLVGNGGTGVLNIQNGGQVLVDHRAQNLNAVFVIGQAQRGFSGPLEGQLLSGDGTVNVTGDGSALNIIGADGAGLSIGANIVDPDEPIQPDANGRLTISNGGSATVLATGVPGAVGGTVRIGDANANGVLDVQGAGSSFRLESGGLFTLWDVRSGSAAVTESGSLEVRNTDGGVIIASIGTAVGVGDGDGVVLVDGADSLLSFGDLTNANTSVRIGSAIRDTSNQAPEGNAVGSMEVRNGGVAQMFSASETGTLFVGYQDPESETPIASGTATGSLIVTNGGRLESNGTLVVGILGSRGEVTVANGGFIEIDQSGSAPDGRGFEDLGIGAGGGSGTMTIREGGSFLLRDADLGELTEIAIGYSAGDIGGSTGRLEVFGNDASFVVDAGTSRLFIADDGEDTTGVVAVGGGATVTISAFEGESRVQMGTGGGESELNISGVGTRFNVVGQANTAMSIAGNSRVSITDSAVVEILSPDSGDLIMSDASRVSVGSGAALRMDGNAYIGSFDEGAANGLTFTLNNGELQAGFVEVGRAAGAAGSGPAAFFRGQGLVNLLGGDIVLRDGGVISPGNGPDDLGTLNIAGNFISDPGGILEIDALEDGTSDSLSISGTATLNGGIVSALTPDSEFSVARDYTILIADGGLTGTFGSVTSNLPYLIPSLAYTANSVVLSLGREDGLIQGDILETTNAQQLSVAARVIPRIIQTQTSNSIRSLLEQEGNEENGSGSSVAASPFTTAMGLSAGDETGASGSAWLNITPTRYDQRAVLPGAQGLQEIDGDSVNFLVGVDRVFGKRVVAGAFLGYEDSEVEYRAIAGEQSNEGALFGAYAGVAFNSWLYSSVNANFAYLENTLEERAFNTTESQEAEYDSARYSIGIDLTATGHSGAVNYMGQLAYNYSNEDYDSYRTNRGELVQLDDLSLGRFSVTGEFSYRGEQWHPYVSLSYEYDSDVSSTVTDDNGLVVNAGLRAVGSDRLTFEAYLATVTSRDNENQELVGLNINYAF